MIYKDFQDLKLSALGMGAMRLPVTAGDDSAIDEAATAEMVAYAIEKGINYFDTAWGYHGGHSEECLASIRGRAFIWQQNFRDMTFPTWIRQRGFLRNSLRSAGWNTLISICSTMYAR